MPNAFYQHPGRASINWTALAAYLNPFQSREATALHARDAAPRRPGPAQTYLAPAEPAQPRPFGTLSPAPAHTNSDIAAAEALGAEIAAAHTPADRLNAAINALTYFGGGEGQVALNPTRSIGNRSRTTTYAPRRIPRPVPPRTSPNAWQGPIRRRTPYTPQAPKDLDNLVPWELLRDRASDPEALFSRSRYDGPKGPYFHGTTNLNMRLRPSLHYWSRDPNNIVGPGLYRTNDAPIAAGYAQNRGPVWHTRAIRPQNLLPLDQPFTEAHPLYKAMHEFLTDPNKTLTRDPVDTRGYRELALEQLYNSAHPGRGYGTPTALEVAMGLTPAEAELATIVGIVPQLGRNLRGDVRTMADIIPRLRRMGFTGVEHTGGIQGGRQHNVQVHWNPFQDLKFEMASAPPSTRYTLQSQRNNDLKHMEDLIMWGYDPIALQSAPIGTQLIHPISNRPYVRTKTGARPAK